MTKLTRPTYEVWLNPVDEEADPLIVQVTSGDQMRAELECKRLGLPPLSEAPLNATAVWIWSAMVRDGLTEAKAPQFLAQELGEWRPLRDASGDAVNPEVDPTKADPSGSASS
jgi:hypothetical protein